MSPQKTRLLSPSSKGQITLPAFIRRQLNVNSNTVLNVSIKDHKIILEPYNLDDMAPKSRVYSSAEIDEFLAADKLSPEDAEFFKKLLY